MNTQEINCQTVLYKSCLSLCKVKTFSRNGLYIITVSYFVSLLESIECVVLNNAPPTLRAGAELCIG